MSEITIYTDGACSPNPGTGGWSAILVYNLNGKPVEKELSGGALESTNNIMEMTAVLESLRALKRACNVTVYSDSKYVVDGIGCWKDGEPSSKGWMVAWERRGWCRSDGPLLNKELWKSLFEQAVRHQKLTMRWVRGHDGHVYNERCDFLAVEARRLIYEQAIRQA